MNNKQEFILCAAICYKNIVICGYRHSNCIHIYYKLASKKTIRADVQGFLTSKNRFVTRAEVADIAYKAGQIKNITDCLISEDIY